MVHRMRFIVILLGLTLTFTARLTTTAATDAAFAQATEFSGTYQGVMANLPTALVLEQQGSVLTGTMQAQNESPYTISGTVSGRVARGELVYTRDGATFGFEARLNDSGLTWTTTLFGVPLPQTATDFQREGELTETKPHHSVSGGDRSREPAGRARDQQLVGRWSHSESYTSGDFSVASEQFVEFRAEGTFSFIGSRSDQASRTRDVRGGLPGDYRDCSHRIGQLFEPDLTDPSRSILEWLQEPPRHRSKKNFKREVAKLCSVL